MASSASFVRLALPAEAGDIATIQRRLWAPGHPAHAMLERLTLEEMTAAWANAIFKPPLASLRVLVATEDNRVVGFSVVGPSDDEDATRTDGLVAEFGVDPLARGRGHGTRLVQAAVDTLRADGFDQATWWVPSTDDALRGLLTSMGFEADGAHSEVGTDDETARVKLVRLQALIGD